MIWLKRCPSRLTKLSTSSWIFSLIFFHRPLFFMRHQWMRITNSRHDISLEVHSNDWRDLENSHMTSTILKDVSCTWHNDETKILTKSQAGKNFNRPIQFQNLHLTRFKVFPLQDTSLGLHSPVYLMNFWEYSAGLVIAAVGQRTSADWKEEWKF